jgi:hypothetical protein
MQQQQHQQQQYWLQQAEQAAAERANIDERLVRERELVSTLDSLSSSSSFGTD